MKEKAEIKAILIMSEQEFEEKLIVGAKIKIGKLYAKDYGFEQVS